VGIVRSVTEIAYGRSPKLQVTFEIEIPSADGELETVSISKFYNFSRKRGGQIGPRSHLRRDLVATLGRPLRDFEQLVPEDIFVGQAFRVSVRTVREAGDGKPLEERDWYSVVDKLIEPIGRRSGRSGPDKVG
jgi:hypothetical protein